MEASAALSISLFSEHRQILERGIPRIENNTAEWELRVDLKIAVDVSWSKSGNDTMSRVVAVADLTNCRRHRLFA